MASLKDQFQGIVSKVLFAIFFKYNLILLVRNWTLDLSGSLTRYLISDHFIRFFVISTVNWLCVSSFRNLVSSQFWALL